MYKMMDKTGQAKKQGNNTGIPEQMKRRYEALSGFSFDDVRVHYNSDEPEKLHAKAYTEGNRVYISPGQEKYLGHELGHVIQQKRGLVRPTTAVGGVPVNDDPGLEAAADNLQNAGGMQPASQPRALPGIIQRTEDDIAKILALTAGKKELVLEAYCRLTFPEADEKKLEEVKIEEELPGVTTKRERLTKKDKKKEKIKIRRRINPSELYEYYKAKINEDYVTVDTLLAAADDEVQEKIIQLLTGKIEDLPTGADDYHTPEQADVYPETFTYDVEHFAAKNFYTQDFFDHHFAATFKKARSITTGRGTSIPTNTVMIAGQLKNFYENEVCGKGLEDGIYTTANQYSFWILNNPDPAPQKGDVGEARKKAQKKVGEEMKVKRGAVTFGLRTITGVQKINHLAGTANIQPVSKDPLKYFMNCLQESVGDLHAACGDNDVLETLYGYVNYNYMKLNGLITADSDSLDLESALQTILLSLEHWMTVIGREAEAGNIDMENSREAVEDSYNSMDEALQFVLAFSGINGLTLPDINLLSRS